MLLYRDRELTDDIEIYREVPGARIPGGSEDVLLDLAIRQLTKQFRAQLAEETTQAKI